MGLRCKITDIGSFWYRLHQKPKTFPIEFYSPIGGNARDVAARMRNAWHESQGDRIGSCRHNRDRCRRQFERQCDCTRHRENQVGMRADHITGEISIVLGPPLAGVSLHRKVLSLSVAKATQLLEKGLIHRRTMYG